jgi:DNA mismatch repair ATPase MutL
MLHIHISDTHRYIDRLVESSRIKKALEAVYVSVLPKGASPFIYLRYFSILLY